MNNECSTFKTNPHDLIECLYYHQLKITACCQMFVTSQRSEIAKIKIAELPPEDEIHPNHNLVSDEIDTVVENILLDIEVAPILTTKKACD
eukprot:UN05601